MEISEGRLAAFIVHFGKKVVNEYETFYLLEVPFSELRGLPHKFKVLAADTASGPPSYAYVAYDPTQGEQDSFGIRPEGENHV